MTDPNLDGGAEASLPAPVPPARRPTRLYQAAAWVGIVAGTLFIVATVFVAGFLVGRNSGDFGTRQHPWGGAGGRMGPPMMTMMPMPPMMPMAPGERGPGPGTPPPRPS